MHLSPVRVGGSGQEFAASIQAKYAEIQSLCSSENDGPRDSLQKNPCVRLENGEQTVTHVAIPGFCNSYGVDHNPKNRDQGARLVESFTENEQHVLKYSRFETRDGFTVGRVAYVVNPGEGTLTTLIDHCSEGVRNI